MIRGRELLLRILQEGFKALDTLVTRDELALRDGDLLLERAILLHELSLYVRELLQVALEEGHLLLLRAVVG